MLWKLLQLTVFFGVACTGIYYQWTPNGLLLSIVAGLAALAVTVLLSNLFRFLSWCFKPRSILPHKRQDGGLTRWR